MRSRVSPVLLTCLILLGLAAAPVWAEQPFEGRLHVIIMITDGSGSVHRLSFFDCWEIRKQGAIRPVDDHQSQVTSGRILKQTRKGRDALDRIEFRAVVTGLGRIRGNLTLEAFGGQVALGGTWRGRVANNVRLAGSLALVPARSGAFCGNDVLP